jgi:hypothetical protein
MKKVLQKIKELKILLNQVDPGDFTFSFFKSIVERTKTVLKVRFGEKNKYLDELLEIDYGFEMYFKSKSIESLNIFFLKLIDILEISRDESDREVFVVHGRDESMKISVARFLEQIKLKPIILDEQPGIKPLIDKFIQYSDVKFAIVLLSGDDIGYLRESPQEKYKLRPRQNVIFELGYFIGKLGKEYVFPLYRDEERFEIPSDYHGICYIPFDEKKGDWKTILVRELKHVGFDIDANLMF